MKTIKDIARFLFGVFIALVAMIVGHVLYLFHNGTLTI